MGTFHFIPTHEHPTMFICIYTITPVAEVSFTYGLLTSWAPAFVSPAVITNGSENILLPEGQGRRDREGDVQIGQMVRFLTS